MKNIKTETENFTNGFTGVEFEIIIKNELLNLKLIDVKDSSYFYTKKELEAYNIKHNNYYDLLDTDSQIINNKFDNDILQSINNFLKGKNTFCIYDLPSTDSFQHSNMINSRFLKMEDL